MSTSSTTSRASRSSNRDYFFYYQGHIPSAVRYKNWKFYYTMMGATGVECDLGAPETYAWTQIDNIMRDPFESRWGDGDEERHRGTAVPSPPRARRICMTGTSCPSASCMWMKELESYVEFPPLQDGGELQPLDQVLAAG